MVGDETEDTSKYFYPLGSIGPCNSQEDPKF